VISLQGRWGGKEPVAQRELFLGSQVKKRKGKRDQRELKVEGVRWEHNGSDVRGCTDSGGLGGGGTRGGEAWVAWSSLSQGRGCFEETEKVGKPIHAVVRKWVAALGEGRGGGGKGEEGKDEGGGAT